MVSCVLNFLKCNELLKFVEEEEILEIKMFGFVCLFGCDICEYSNYGSRYEVYNIFFDGSEDDFFLFLVY